MGKKPTTNENVGHIDLDYRSVSDVIKELNELLDKIPDQYKKSATIEGQRDYGDNLEYFVHYERPCNEDELAKRKEKELQRQQWEIAQLKELQKKYPKLK